MNELQKHSPERREPVTHHSQPDLYEILEQTELTSSDENKVSGFLLWGVLGEFDYRECRENCSLSGRKV